MPPMELITLLGSTILSGILKLIGARTQQRQAQHDMMMARFDAEAGERQNIREVKQEGFQWTRRTIALMSIFSIIVLPKVVGVIDPSIPITLGWTEMQSGFWPFIEGAEKMKWHIARGVVITPLDTHLASAIAGLYFGGSLVGHKR